MQRILIIKLGALGDFIQAASTMEAIREHYGATCHITLLTTPPFQDLAEKLNIFDSIWAQGRYHGVRELWKLRQQILNEKFDIVFDLQGVDRTNILYWAMWPKAPKWVGTATGCTYRYKGDFHRTHPSLRYQNMLSMVEIDHQPKLDLSKLIVFSAINVPDKPFVLLIAGASKSHKRWAEDNYVRLAEHLIAQNVVPVIIGTSADGLTHLPHVKGVLNLIDQTNIYDIIKLANVAAVTIGNDTGPQLIAASGGCRSITLYTTKNSPEIGGPYGKSAISLCKENICSIKIDDVLNVIQF